MPGTARRLARRYLPLRVRQRLVAVRSAVSSAAPAAPAKKSAAKKATPAKSSVGQDALVRALRSGRPLADAIVAEVRSLSASGEHAAASSIAASLAKESETAGIGALANAIVAYQRGYLVRCWTEFQAVPSDLRWRHAAAEYVRSGIKADRERIVAEVRELAAGDPSAVDAQSWSDVLGVVFGADEEELARQIFAILDAAVGDGTGKSDPLVVNRDWMRRWVAASANSPSAAVPDGHVSIGIMDYGHPGRFRASANIGDHVQSLASLGHLVRHQDISFNGPQDLVDLLEQLHGRVRPEMQRTGIAADVDVMTIDRDASMYKAVPPNTWTLAFGWFMHAIFEQRYGFPFHHNVLPIFLSFHCNKRDLLTDAALEYLRRFGPIGCRDWTTVDILLSVDVPAFFSGCMTTTTSTVFPDLADKPSTGAPVAYVDMPDSAVPAGAPTYKHSSDAVRFRSFTMNVYDAMELLETYRRTYSSLVTTRLHCWLPARSIGMTVDFQPKNRSDIRFAGLIDTTETEFDAIRNGINGRLEKVMSAILSGEDADTVYDLWRSLNADDVEIARRRREARPPALPTRADLTGDVAAAVKATIDRPASAPTDGPSVDVVIDVPANRRHALEVLLSSLTAHTSAAVHVWLLTEDPGSIRLPALERSFPSLALSMVPTRGLGRSLQRGDGRKVVTHDTALLALAELLPGVDRAVVLPVDAVLTGDVAELAGIELGGRLLAAPTVVGTTGASGFGVIHTAALRLGPKTVSASDLRHRAYARHAFGFDAFTTAVLVLDLAKMRAEGFLAEYVPFVEAFGLTARDVLHLAVGPDRAVVPEYWDNVPTRSDVEGNGLVHWSDSVKPWSEDYTAKQELWWSEAAALERGRQGAA